VQVGVEARSGSFGNPGATAHDPVRDARAMAR
jgi:hypothetical protein